MPAAGGGKWSDDPTLARAFEPYFTTKAAGEGTGLGLATCRDIIDATGGAITAASSPGAGTIVNVRLPLAPAAQRVPPRDAYDADVTPI